MFGSSVLIMYSLCLGLSDASALLGRAYALTARTTGVIKLYQGAGPMYISMLWKAVKQGCMENHGGCGRDVCRMALCIKENECFLKKLHKWFEAQADAKRLFRNECAGSSPDNNRPRKSSLCDRNRFFHSYMVDTAMPNCSHILTTVVSRSKYAVKAKSLKRRLYGLYGVKISGRSAWVAWQEEHLKRSGLMKQQLISLFLREIRERT